MSRASPSRVATPRRPRKYNLLSNGGVKGKTGIGALYAVPQMDWDLIRRAKTKCVSSCASFDDLTGECSGILISRVLSFIVILR